MREKLHITDLSLLKITKVKPWSILFDYGDRHFLIHGESEYGEDSGQVFYERFLDENGHYTLRWLNRTWYVTDDLPFDYIRDLKRHNPIIYNQINKEFFVYKLTKREFASGIMEDRVQIENKRLKELKETIRKQEESLNILRFELRKWQ